MSPTSGNNMSSPPVNDPDPKADTDTPFVIEVSHAPPSQNLSSSQIVEIILQDYDIGCGYDSLSPSGGYDSNGGNGNANSNGGFGFNPVFAELSAFDIARFSSEIELFGGVAVEKAVKLGQCDTLEEIADYVEKHQGEEGWEELDAPKRARLEILAKILRKIAADPLDERWRRLRVGKLKEKGLNVPSVIGLGKNINDTVENNNTATDRRTATASTTSSNNHSNNHSNNQGLLSMSGFILEKKVMNKTPPFILEDVFFFGHPIDTDLPQVQTFHRLLSVLDEVLYGGPVVEEVEEGEGDETCPSMGIEEESPLKAGLGSTSGPTRTASTSTRHRGLIPPDPPDLCVNAPITTKNGGGISTENGGSLPPSPSNQGAQMDMGQIQTSDGRLTRAALADLHEMRAKNKQKWVTANRGNGGGYQASSGTGRTTRNNQITGGQGGAGQDGTGSYKRGPTQPPPAGSSFFGSMWNYFGNNTDDPSSSSSSSSARNPNFRHPGESGGDDGSNDGYNTSPYRKSRHFTLKDIEELRYKEAIQNAPRYADEWWNGTDSNGEWIDTTNIPASAKTGGSGGSITGQNTYTNIRMKSYHPAYLGRRALDLTNVFRGENGLPPLKWNEGITIIAREHAEQMGRGEMPFSHDGFGERVSRFSQYGVYSSSSAENLAYNSGNSDPAAMAVDGWIKSPGHRKNLLSLTNRCGIGVCCNSVGRFYFTQLFAKTSEGLA